MFNFDLRIAAIGFQASKSGEVEIASSILTFFCSILQSRIVVSTGCGYCHLISMKINLAVDIGCYF